MNEGLNARLDAIVDEAGARWRDAGEAPEAFAEIATEVLSAAALHEHATLGDWLAHLVGLEAFARQVDPGERFGDPPFTLRFCERFALDLYFWHEPSVAIHNHSFHGAFSVLEGCSMHSYYDFEPRETFDEERLQVGEITLRDAELLQRGEARRIDAGMCFIHQVAHLASPCLSLVLRTSTSPSDPAIYDFLTPGIALLQSGGLTESERKKISLIRLLCRLDRADRDEQIAQVLEETSDFVIAWALRSAAEATQQLDVARMIAGKLTPRGWVEPFLSAVGETDSQGMPWAYLPDIGHRLLAVLTASVPDLALRDKIVGAYLPGRSFIDAALEWTEELGERGLFGINALPEAALIALRGLLEGGDEGARASLAERYGGAPEAFSGHVQQMRAFFEAHPLYQSLLKR